MLKLNNQGHSIHKQILKNVSLVNETGILSCIWFVKYDRYQIVVTKTGTSAVIPDEKKENTPDKTESFKIAGNWSINGIESGVKITEAGYVIYYFLRIKIS